MFRNDFHVTYEQVSHKCFMELTWTLLHWLVISLTGFCLCYHSPVPVTEHLKKFAPNSRVHFFTLNDIYHMDEVWGGEHIDISAHKTSKDIHVPSSEKKKISKQERVACTCAAPQLYQAAYHARVCFLFVLLYVSSKYSAAHLTGLSSFLCS